VCVRANFRWLPSLAETSTRDFYTVARQQACHPERSEGSLCGGLLPVETSARALVFSYSKTRED
jgi:hypothetical protein